MRRALLAVLAVSALLTALGGIAWLVLGDADRDAASQSQDSRPSGATDERVDDDAQRRRVAAPDAPDVAPATATELDPTPAAPDDDDDRAAWTVRVQVVDVGGAPCPGLGVHLRETDSDGDAWTWERAVTDADGLVGFPLERASGSTFAVQIGLPFDPPVSLPVPVPLDPERVLRLALPAAAAVECTVLESDGRPVNGGTVVLRSADGISRPIPRGQNGLEGETDVEAAPIVDGVAHFAWAPVDRELVIAVASRGEHEASSRLRVRSGAAGTTTRVRLVTGTRRATVHGRLIDSEGRPVAAVSLFVDVLGVGGEGWRRHHDGEAVSDDAGEFTVAVDVVPADVVGSALRLARRAHPTSEWQAEELAIHTIPEAFPANGLDLGDIKTRREVLIASGIVVDPEERPVAGATVKVFFEHRRSQWDLASVPEVKTGPDGLFELRGSANDAPLFLGASADRLVLSERTPLAIGTSGVRLLLQPSASIVGRVIGPAGVDVSRLQYSVVGSAVDGGGTERYHQDSGRRATVTADGALLVEHLVAGSATLTVRAGWTAEIASIDDIAVVVGVITLDPRLVPLDLSKLVPTTRIAVRRADGEPVRAATIYYRAAGEDVAWTRTDVDGDGVAVLLARAPALDVVAVARGHRSAATRATPGEVALTLDVAPVTEVTLRIPDDGACPSQPWFMTVEFDRLGPPGRDAAPRKGGLDDPRDLDPWTERFDDSRRARFELWDPGRYGLLVYVWRGHVDGASGETVKLVGGEREIDIDGSGRALELEIRLDPDDLQRILDDE